MGTLGNFKNDGTPIKFLHHFTKEVACQHQTQGYQNPKRLTFLIIILDLQMSLT